MNLPTVSITMSRSTESGAYLGGIGTMLSQVDTCATCGESHRDGVLSAIGFRERECPHAVVGALPYMVGTEAEIRPMGTKHSSGVGPSAVVLPAADRKHKPRDPPLAMLWPPLQPFTEVFP
jgi:hypothetical protein